MAQSKNRLGRGLGGLISGGSVSQAKGLKTALLPKLKEQNKPSSIQSKQC